MEYFSGNTPGKLLVLQKGFWSSGKFWLSVGSWLQYVARFVASYVQQSWFNFLLLCAIANVFKWQIGIFQVI